MSSTRVATDLVVVEDPSGWAEALGDEGVGHLGGRSPGEVGRPQAGLQPSPQLNLGVREVAVVDSLPDLPACSSLVGSGAP